MKETYSLREVVNETGLTKLVLHAWERRYAAIVPKRTETGRRIYQHEDLVRLQLLKACVDNGQRIGSIIHLSNEELKRSVMNQERLDDLEPVFKAVETLDGETLDRLLSTRFIALGPIDFSKYVVLPFMAEIGRRWAEGHLSIASEHLASSSVRVLLNGAFKLLASPRGSHRIVFTTLEGELHDIGGLVAALIARSHGIHITYLGAQLPAKDFVAMARQSGSTVVCISGAFKRIRNFELEIKEVRKGLPLDIPLWLGGAAFMHLPPIEGVCYFQQMEQFEEAVIALQGESF
ncbi:MerR family transcriptional regulator [Agrobacterium vitis]|uniref:MerR family transcriptional regulator n=1 Tax=Agrobacterium vitis TaxID=373 RepID=UPI0015744845|nr:MerR family transcriptional regulator [Agrobacterium vitis]NSZ17170.1 MerR family transcriptional regulator [Agrobacterium vitis]QZO02899.1 MerR family transcriptional regulator [Agrobacterium vitis]UJL88024.1 MerR family transcriptional regulator [Agrobacterium vitis]